VSPLESAGTALSLCALAAFITRRIKSHQCNGMLALSDFLFVLHDLADGRFGSAVVSGTIGAWFALSWWRGGGGDDTKRRLRKLREKFTPARRTAPATT